MLFYTTQRKSGGRYHAVAKVGEIFPIPENSNLLGAEVAAYQSFVFPISYSVDGGFYESSLLSRNWHSLVQRTVRFIPDAEAASILDDDTPFPANSSIAWRQQSGFADPQAPYEMPPRIFDTVTRARRSLRLRSEVVSAYQYRCALTNIGQRSHSGELEADCCHLRPVADGGPDSVNNAMLVIKSLHWAVDRFLISFEDDLRILFKPALEERYRQLLNPNGYTRVPDDPSLRPSLEFLGFHRQRFHAIS